MEKEEEGGRKKLDTFLLVDEKLGNLISRNK